MSKLLNLLVLIFLAACDSAPSQNLKGSLKINIGNEPATLDPRKARDLSSQTLSKMFFEGLTRINDQDQAEWALAESCDVSSDGKFYTFHLRDAVWSNGDPVTAQDFAYAW